MSRPPASRRAVVSLKSGPGQPTLPTIGNRSLHQYWALLKPHFRGILLPPQSQADGTGIQWTWRESADRAPLATTELATVRKRLAGSQRALADSVADAPESVTESRLAGSVLPQLQAHMDAIVTALATQPDATLAGYVVRSEQELLLHSWGLATALTPHYPDDTECEIAGTVLVANAPAPHREVVLENAGGLRLARTRSDAAGRFRFPKISSGIYRARVISDHDVFPPEGISIEVERTSVTGLELCDCGGDRTAAARGTPTSRRHLLLFTLLGSIALVIVGGIWWRSTASPPATAATMRSLAAANVAAETFEHVRADQTEPAALPVSSVKANTEPRASSNKIAPRETPQTSPPPAKFRMHEAKPPHTIAIERRVTGLSVEQSGAPTTGALPPSVASIASASSGADGNISPAAGATASAGGSAATGAFAGTAGSPSGANSSAAGTSSAAAVAASPTPSNQTPPPPAPKPTQPASPATSSGHPPASSLAAVPAQTASASDSGSGPANAEAPTPERPPSATAESDASSDQTTSSDGSDSPTKDLPADRTRSPEPATLTVITTTTDESPLNPSDELASSGEIHLAPLSPTKAMLPSRRVRFSVASWQPRLLEDTILPTAPTRIGDDDALQALRARQSRERHAQIPAMLEHPITRIGFMIEFTTDPAISQRPRWSDDAKAAIAEATVATGRAEISWPGHAPAGANAALLAGDGHEIARITAGDHGALTLVTVAGVRGWAWIGVERPLTDDIHVIGAAWAARLEWRVLSGAPAAPTWRRDDQWLNEHGHRLELVLGEHAGAPTHHTLALVDRVTGWAIVSEIAQAQELPETAASLSR